MLRIARIFFLVLTANLIAGSAAFAAPNFSILNEVHTCGGSTGSFDIVVAANPGGPTLQFQVFRLATPTAVTVVDTTIPMPGVFPYTFPMTGLVAGDYVVVVRQSGPSSSTIHSTTLFDLTPTITGVVDPQVCHGATNASLTYASTTESPDLYTLVFSAAALTDGFVNITDGAFAPPAAITVTIPGTATATTYTADLTVRNSTTGCVSVVEAIQIIINPVVSITPGTNPVVCAGTTTANLTFTGLAGGANQYAIDFDAAANTATFGDVTTTGPLTSPIGIPVPAAVAAGTYNAVLTISNSTTACFATYPITVTVNPLPTITAVVDPQVCLGAASANLTYASTTNSPDRYTLVFGAAAITAGFVDVTDAVFAPPGAITITIPGTATATTYTADLTVRNSTTGCVSVVEAIQIIINPNPTITVVDASVEVCSGISSVNLAYSGVTASPDQYTLVFDAAAITAGFADIVNGPLAGSPIVIAVPTSPAPAAATYNASLTVRNSTTGCVSVVTAIQVIVHPAVSITPGANPVVCAGTTTANLTFTGLAGGANQYAIDFDAAANTATFGDVTTTGPLTSPIGIPVPAAVAAGTYNAVLTISNSTTACFATYPITVTVNPLPTITAVVDPQVCLGAASANLTYASTTNSPDRYTLVFGAAAITAGFVDVTDAVFAPPGAITITIPGTATATTYTADLTVRNSTTGCVSVVEAIQIIINPNPTITVVDASVEVCSGISSVNLAYSGVTASPDQYTLVFDAAAITAGFADVVNGPLAGSPIVIAVPTSPAPAAATYNASLTVRNSTTGCVSSVTAIQVIVHPAVSITPGANPVVCAGTTTANLTFTGLAGGANQYAIDFDAAANTATFGDVTTTGPLTSPIGIPVPAAVAAGTYNAVLTISNSTTACFATYPITVTVNPLPTITAVVDPQVCLGAASANLTYASTTNSPDRYTLVFGAAAITAGFVDVTDAVFAPPGAITITIPGTATATTYTADLTVRNSTTGCVSVVEAIQIIINPVVSITPGTNPVVCAGTTTANLTFTGLAGGANQYAIDFDAAANTATFGDVTTTGPLTSPIGIPVPAAVAAGTYNAVLTISNSTTACFATYPITVTVNPLPTITAVVDPQVCLGAASANLTYASTTNSPDRYTLVFGAAAITAGFVDVTDAVFAPPGAITITIPGTATATTYTADLTVRNSTTGCVSVVEAIQIIINPNPTITVVDASVEVCSGISSVNLAYSGVTASPDQYTLVFDAAAITAGFADIVNGPLAGSPIVIAVPTSPAPAAATYNANLTVRNSTTGCVSSVTAIQVIVHPAVSITPGANPVVCAGTTTANLTFTGLAGGANQYAIDFDAAANTATFGDVTTTGPLTSPIGIPVPAAVAAGTYNAVLTISNSTTACFATYPITVTVNPLPTITAVVDPQVCLGAASANLTYASTTNSPDRYTLVFGAAAITAGFVDVTDAVFAPPGAITITIPGTATATTYTADLTVRNSTTGCVSVVEAIQIIINPVVSITPGTNPVVCAGTTTANLTFTGLAGGANQYAIDFDAAANTATFGDVTTTGPLTSPIGIPVPAAVAAGTYNAVLTISNSTTACFATYPITVTVNPLPTITAVVDPQVCLGAASANLTYASTTNSPDRYTLVFGAAAITAGFVDVTDAVFAPPGAITITIPGTATATTYTADLTVRNSTTGCVSVVEAIQIIINPNPTITVVDASVEVCSGISSVNLAYSGVTASPDQYTLVFDAAAITAGFADIVNGPLAGSPIVIAVPTSPAPAAATYNANLTVRNSTTGCVSVVTAIQVIVHPAVSITPGANPVVCAGTTTANLTFTGLAGGANQYAIDFDAAANTATFGDVTTTGPLTSPIGIPVPAAVAAGTYNAVLTISNSTTACFATYPITVTVNPLPTITAVVDPQVCLGAASANLTYASTTNSPDRYTLVFGAAAITAGFVDVTDAVFAPPGAITITIPGTATATTYTADLTVRNSTTGCVSVVEAIQIIINPNPTITVVDASVEVCSGISSVNLAYSGVTASPDQYTLVFDAAAITAGFADVVNGPLAGSPIVIAVPTSPAPAAATYNASLTVRNSTTGCVSVVTAIQVIVHPAVSITPGTNPAVCSGTTTANLTFTGLTGGADQYAIDFNPAANTAGFADVTTTGPLTSPVGIAVPALVAAGTYNATLTISNSTTTCSASYAITVTVNPLPTITGVVDPQVCLGATTANLTYAGTTATPDRYTIVFGASAITAGFIDVTDAAFVSPAAIVITVPGSAAVGTYDADLTVRNSTTGCVSVVEAIQITINPNPTITVVDASVEVCSGISSVDLAYSGVTASPDQYSLVFDGAAITAGFADVVNGPLAGSPIVIAVPTSPAPAAATYNANVTVRNSTTGCVSSVTAIQVIVHPAVTITPGTNPSVCSGTTTANLTFTGLAGGADQYAIDFDAAANTATFSDVTTTGPLTSPIGIPVPASVAAGTYNAVLTISNNTTSCFATYPFTVTVNPNPTITGVVDPQVCLGATTANLTYAGTTATPDRYTVVFGASAITAGFVDATDATFVSPAAIVITVPGSAAVGTYDADLTVRNSTTGCVSVVEAIQITINPPVSITPGANPSVCSGTTTANLTFTGLAGGADQYAIDFDAAANTATFGDVTTTGPLTSPIGIPVPASVAAGTYNAVLTISNSTTACFATYPITVTVNPLPTITGVVDPQVCLGATTANLTYAGTTATPDRYTIVFGASAITAGFVDVTDAAFVSPTAITITVPGSAAAGTYDADLTVRNSTTGCVSVVEAIQIIVNPNPSITVTDASIEVCSGTTSVNLAYSGPTSGPDQYSLTFSAAAITAGFADVVNGTLTASPIVIVVPSAPAAGIYNADLTVLNSSTGCVSSVTAVTVEVHTTPVVSLGASPVVCGAATSTSLSYTVAAGAPDRYSIDFSSAANTAGFNDVAITSLVASPLPITIPGASAPGVYSATLTVEELATGCFSTQSFTVTISQVPTITSVIDPQVCLGATSVNLTYSSTTDSPDRYTIVFGAAAITAGFVDVTDAVFAPPADIVITIPGSASAGTYLADLTVRNSTSGCVSVVEAIQITISPAASITPGANPSVSAGTTTANLTFTGLTGGADEYAIDFDLAANTAGFGDVTTTGPLTSPIGIPVPVSVAAGTYDAVLTISNSTTTCFATYPITVTVNGLPTITSVVDPQVCLGAPSANLTYASTTESPDRYTIVFGAAAITAGFVDVTDAVFAPPAAIVITIPGSAAAGTYDADLTVRNSTTGAVSVVEAIQVIINPGASITVADASVEVCSGTTSVNLAYSAPTGSPDEYSLDFDATAITAGFADVVNGSLTASPIVIAVPASPAAGIYNADLTVRNSTTGCVSSVTAITVEVHTTPVVSLGASPVVCTTVTSSTLSYTVSAGAPDRYSIEFDAVADAAGFADVALTNIVASPVPIAIPAAVAPGVYNAVFTVLNQASGCASAQVFTVSVTSNQAITLGSNPVVCQTITSANLTYSATTSDEYTIDFSAAANGQGFIDITAFTPLAAAPSQIAIVVPGAVAAGTYNANLTIRTGGAGCTTTTSFQVIVNPIPAITVADPSREVCSGTASVNLVYSLPTGSPNQYSLDFDATANTAGFADVVNGTLTASPIVIAVPTGPAPAAGIYNANLTVRNSTTGCVSTVTAVTVQVNTTPTVTLGTSQAVCSAVTTTTLPYTVTAGTPDRYSMDFNAAANASGFIDIVLANLVASPLSINIPASAAPGIYSATLRVQEFATGCFTTQPFTVTVTAHPTINAVVDPQVCVGATSATLTYTSTTNSPNRYSIDFGAAALTAGFVNVTDVTFTPPAAIVVTIPGSATAGTYDANLTVRNNTTGCGSSVEPIQIIINPTAVITPGANPIVCSGTTTANLTFTGLTGGANQYAINFDVAANTAGFGDVITTGLLASPIAIPVPAAVAVGTYNAVLTISNSATACPSTYPITVTVSPNPTITLGSNPVVCQLATSANLPYSATTGEEYTIDFATAANTQGFVDVTSFTPLTAAPSQIAIVVPGAAAAGTYNANLTIRDSGTGCTTTTAFQVIVNPSPAITVADPILDACTGAASVNLVFSGAIGSPNQYSLDFDAAAVTAGFADIVNASLTTSPIVVAIPTSAAAAAGTYNANLTVRNTTTGCVGAVIAVTVEVHATPSVTLSASQAVCSATTVTTLPYTVSAGTPDRYSMDFNAAANASGFIDVVLANLVASPLPINVPASAAPGIYSAVLRVQEFATGCFSTQTFTVTVNPHPTITGVIDPQVCIGALSASFTYTSTTQNPNRYSIAFGAAALTAGFVDVTDAVFAPPAAIVVTIPGSALAGVYDANLSVRNGATNCLSAVEPIQIIINPTPGITPDANPVVCSGATTADFTFTGLTGGADQYSIDFDAIATAQGFIDVGTTGSLASPIAIAVPAAAAVGTYNAVLTISSSAATCTSNYAITVKVDPNPTITLGPNPEVCQLATSASLTYSATTADEYTIDFGTAAETEGFVDITALTPLTAAPSDIVIVVPSAAAAGTYDADLTIRDSATGCTTTTNFQVIVNPNPTISLDFTNPAVCSGVTGVDITYNATTGSPTEYSIDFDGVAEGVSFADVSNASLTASTIAISVPAGAPVSIYNANLTVRNAATGCVSAIIPITIAVNDNPTITLGASPYVCQGVTTASLPYTGTTTSPDQYTIDFDAAAEAGGFVDVVATTLPASPVTVPVPLAAAMGVYNATITVYTSSTGCQSAAVPFTVTVGIDITAGTPAPVCISNNALIPVTPVVGDPDLYSLDFDAAAEADGFVDVVDAALPVGNITVAVPANIGGIFNASLTVKNSTTGCISAAKPISIEVGSTIALGTGPEVCEGGTSADLTYAITTGGPDQYSIDFDVTAEAAGFVDVTDAALPASPIVIVVPATAAVAVYSYTVTVKNSVSGCGSVLTPRTITVSLLPSANAGTDATTCAGVPYFLAGSSVGGSASTGAWIISSQPTGGDGALSDVAQVADPTTVSFSATVAGDYVMTLITDDPASSCSPVQDDVTITITPMPVVASGQAKSICGSDDVAFEILLNPANFPANTILSWPDPDGAGPGTAGVNVPVGAGTIHINDRLVNTTNADITVTYQITPSVAACVGSMEPIAITVHPAPILALGQNKTICSGDNVAFEILLNPTNTPAGTTLSWPDPDGAGSGTSQLNVAADPAGIAQINDVLYNGTGAPVQVIYSIIATAPSGCRAIPRDVVITVNPGAIVDAGLPQSICSAGTATLTASSIGGLATTGVWSIFASPAGGDGALSDGAQTATPSIVTFTASVAGDYTIRLTSDDPAGTCVGVMDDVVITVRPVGDAGCTAPVVTGDCSTVVITPKPSPATCTNSDGSIIFTIKPFVPAVLTTEVRIDIVGVSPSNNTISRTVHNDSTFNNLPVGVYDYTIEYGDPSCIKTGQVTIDRSGTVDVPTFTNLVDPLCFGVHSGSATIDVVGETGNVLQWSADGSSWTPFIAGNTVSGLPGGTNIISIRRDASDPCASGATIMLANPLEIVTTLTSENATCNNNDGRITVGSLTGGVGPYTFSLNGTGLTLPGDNIIQSRAAGNYSLVITDALGCFSTISTTVAFPDFVHHTTPVITHPDCTGAGANGTISFQITDIGNFEFGVTTSLVAEPATYSPLGGAQVTVTDLANGRYAVWLRPVAAGTQCATKVGDLVVSGIFPVTLQAANTDVVCLEDAADVTLSTITGAPSVDYTYELTNTGDNSITTGVITAGQALSAFTISDVNPGSYSLRLLQDQSSLNAGCTAPISSAAISLLVEGPTDVLDTISVTRKLSYPDLPTGSAQVVINPSGGVPYELRLELMAPEFPGQAFVQDWTTVTESPTDPKFEYTFDKLYSGVYEMRLRDDFGCEHVYEVTIGTDTAFDPNSIPNIFTPNGDQLNDVFYVRNLPVGSSLIVTNRWGKEVYKSGTYDNKWDGSDASDGIYYFELKTPGQAFSGWLEIFRGL